MKGLTAYRKEHKEAKKLILNDASMVLLEEGMIRHTWPSGHGTDGAYSKRRALARSESFESIAQVVVQFCEDNNSSQNWTTAAQEKRPHSERSEREREQQKSRDILPPAPARLGILPSAPARLG